MKNFILLCLAVLAVGASGCSGIPGSGTIQKKNYAVSPFDKVELSGIGSITITVGETESLSIETDDNLQQYMKVEVVDGRLTISQTENINPSDGVEIQIVTEALKDFVLSGAAEGKLIGIKETDLNVKISGAGSVSGEGEVDNLTVRVSGAGSLELEELKAKNLKVRISGAGSAEVYASESLDASVSGAGSIDCAGSPKDVERSVSGVGSIDVK